MSTSVFSTINSVLLAFALNDMLTLFDAQVLVIKASKVEVVFFSDTGTVLAVALQLWDLQITITTARYISHCDLYDSI